MTTSIHETDDFTVEHPGASSYSLPPHRPKARTAGKTAIRETVQMLELLDPQQANGDRPHRPPVDASRHGWSPQRARSKAWTAPEKPDADTLARADTSPVAGADRRLLLSRRHRPHRDLPHPRHRERGSRGPQRLPARRSLVRPRHPRDPGHARARPRHRGGRRQRRSRGPARHPGHPRSRRDADAADDAASDDRNALTPSRNRRPRTFSPRAPPAECGRASGPRRASGRRPADVQAAALHSERRAAGSRSARRSR